MARSDKTDSIYTIEEVQLRNKMRKRGMDMFRRRYDYSDGNVGKYAEKKIEAEAAINALTDPKYRYLDPEERKEIARNTGREVRDWHMRRFAPKDTKININGKDYTSLDAIQKERDDKAHKEKIDNALNILKTKDGKGHHSVYDLTSSVDKLTGERDTLIKQGRGDSLTTRLNSAYRDNLHSRRLAAAKQNQDIRNESGNGKPSGPSLIATDTYGRPVRPVNPLKNFKGPMSVKAREQLAIQHAVQEAAWRTADAQWRAENPNLVGRDVASLDRGTFMMSEQARGIEAQHKADQSILRGINQDLAGLTKSIDAANFLKDNGYRYDDKKNQWITTSNNTNSAT